MKSKKKASSNEQHHYNNGEQKSILKPTRHIGYLSAVGMVHDHQNAQLKDKKHVTLSKIVTILQQHAKADPMKYRYGVPN